MGVRQVGSLRVRVAVSGEIQAMFSDVLAGFAASDHHTGEVTSHWEVAVSGTAESGTRYDLRRDSRTVVTGVEAAVVAEHLMWHVTQAAVAGYGVGVVLHAGCLSGPNGAVVLPGTAGSGKTTLTAGLVAAGWGYLSDELGLVDPDGRRVESFARPLCMTRNSVDLFPGLGDRLDPLLASERCDKLQVPASALRDAPFAETTTLRAVVFPRYEPGAKTVSEPLRKPETLLALLPNTFDLDGRRLGVLARLCRAVPGYRLVSGDIDEAIAEVVRLSREASTPPAPCGLRPIPAGMLRGLRHPEAVADQSDTGKPG